LRLQAERLLLAYPGFAGVPADASITAFGDLVEMVVSHIDCPTALIAQSMGGVLAIEAAIRKQSLVTHLVLIATSGGLDTSQLGAVNWRPSFEREHPDLPDWFTSFNADLTSELSRINPPVLLLWGDCDPISPIRVGKVLLSHLRNATLHVVPGGQHDLAFVHAQLIAPLIDAHLQLGRAFWNARSISVGTHELKSLFDKSEQIRQESLLVRQDDSVRSICIDDQSAVRNELCCTSARHRERSTNIFAPVDNQGRASDLFQIVSNI
jgi:pimeloyl-ACP methyl ester carboxylesterase